jgi:hypothetical protein
MKRLLLFALILGSLYLVVSCTKVSNVKPPAGDSTVVQDTTIIRDTTVVKDTTVVRDTVHLNPIVGLWVGTYKVIGGVATDSFYYSFDIQANGRVITTAIGGTSNSISSAGPWQLSGTAFTSTLTTLGNVTPENVQAVTAAYDSTAGTLTGTAIFTQGIGQNSTFYMIRVP